MAEEPAEAAKAAKAADTPNPPAAGEAGAADSHRSSPPRRRRWVWLLVLAAVAAAVVVVAVSHHEKAKQAAAAAAQRNAAAAAVTIASANATRGNIGVYIDAIGTVTPLHTDSITSQVNGLVVAVHYKEGQLVHAGDALLDVDPRPYQATLLQAQGTLEKDENVLAQARMDLERYRTALARNAIAEQQAADQEKVVLQDQGVVKNDQGTVQFDSLQVAYCHITAPIAGQVGLRLVDPGNVVQASGGVTLVVITQLQPITVVFTVPEDSLGPVASRLRNQAKLAVDVFDRTAQTKLASGELLALDNQVDTTTGTVKGRAQFANADYALFPNQFVNARLLVNTLEGVTLVPTSTIQRNGQAASVFVIQNNTAFLRPVKTGVTDGGLTQVEGVNPGDVLANSNFDKLQNNTKVALANPPAAAPHVRGGTALP
jgi:multidrug efflux system membrane fusion protein